MELYEMPVVVAGVLALSSIVGAEVRSLADYDAESYHTYDPNEDRDADEAFGRN